ncbi:MAG: response regulator transcription factor [Leptolyngbya sp. SIOISBB]|nr:response regulator transcription factor [Leptolyngbya sp. SIOISBB]
MLPKAGHCLALESMPTILIAEDEPKIVAFLKKGLQRSGFDTEVTEDGSTVLTQATQEAFDLLILDLGLPNNDGLEVLQRLRACDSSLPVLVITARSLGHQDLQLLRTFGAEVVQKPFRMRDLLQKVRSILDQSPE